LGLLERHRVHWRQALASADVTARCRSHLCYLRLLWPSLASGQGLYDIDDGIAGDEVGQFLAILDLPAIDENCHMLAQPAIIFEDVIALRA
jgi:hypothetical protein